MRRREFIKTGGAALTGLALRGATFAQRPSPAGGRIVLQMNRNWRFSAARAAGDTSPGFDDSSFEQVTIPHSNKRLPWHSFDEKAYQFVSIYRRRFRLPAEARGRLVFVDFEGAMTASKVWLNGHYLGEYKGGYTPFSFELTPSLDWSGENLLAVEVDSTERPDIPPFGGEIDYLTFGGIYRDVRLRFVPRTYIQSFFARPQDAGGGDPSLHVVCVLGGDTQQPVTLEAELQFQGRTVATGRQTTQNRHEVLLENLGGVTRWELNSPALYTVVARLRDQANRVLDEDHRRIGFRHAEFTDHGFELNG